MGIILSHALLRFWRACRDDDGAPESGIRTDVNLNHEVYYHFHGTEQSDDVMCWRDPEHPKYIYTPEVTEDGMVHLPLPTNLLLPCSSPILLTLRG